MFDTLARCWGDSRLTLLRLAVMPLKRAVTEFGKTYKDRFALRTYPGTSVPIFIFILGWSRGQNCPRGGPEIRRASKLGVTAEI